MLSAHIRVESYNVASWYGFVSLNETIQLLSDLGENFYDVAHIIMAQVEEEIEEENV